MWASGAYGYLSDYLWWWLVLASLLIHTWCFFRFFPRTRLRKLGLVLGNLLVMLTMLEFAGLVGETYVRFLVVETDSYGASLVAKRWFLIHPELNSLYCRDAEWSEHKPEGVYRVAFVGDSFTYGWGINEVEDRFSDIIQARFNERSPGTIEVMNVAWAGWDTSAELGAVHDMIQDYGVDEVVLCWVPNDIETLLPTTPDFDPKKPPKSRYINTDNSFLLDYLYHRIFARHTPMVLSYWDWLADGYENREIWVKERRILERIVELCAEHDVRLRVALLPFIQTRGKHYDASAIQAKVASVFAGQGIPVVDLLPTIEGKDAGDLVVNSHDPHPNEAAHRLFADAIWRAFYAAGLPRREAAEQ